MNESIEAMIKSTTSNLGKIRSSLSTLSKRERALYSKGEMDIIIGKNKMYKTRMHLRSNRNELMAFLIKSLASNGRVFLLHEGNPSTFDKKGFLSAYRDFSITNDRNFPKILSGEKILHFDTETVDIPEKARPKL